MTITLDAAKTGEELRPIWRFFGADEPNYATMKDGRRLLARLGELKPGAVYFRAHNLLTSGDGTPALKWGSTNAYTEDSSGNPLYDWRIVDLIFDTYLARGVKPLVEIGFMPQALSSAPPSLAYQHEWRPGVEDLSGGWSWPPRDYQRWSELCYQWVNHLVARYGSTGPARHRNSSNSTTMRSRACDVRCQPLPWAGLASQAAAGNSWRISSRT